MDTNTNTPPTHAQRRGPYDMPALWFFPTWSTADRAAQEVGRKHGLRLHAQAARPNPKGMGWEVMLEDDAPKKPGDGLRLVLHVAAFVLWDTAVPLPGPYECLHGEDVAAELTGAQLLDLRRGRVDNLRQRLLRNGQLDGAGVLTWAHNGNTVPATCLKAALVSVPDHHPTGEQQAADFTLRRPLRPDVEGPAQGAGDDGPTPQG